MYENLIVPSGYGDYEVEIADSMDRLFNMKNVITIADKTVVSLYPQLNVLNPVLIDCTEETKTLDGSIKILKELLNINANIKSEILAIGGGILQDIVGFCSSIFCRGIDYTLVPTTLLAQADSCIGGKTSINFQNKKNILGTFYPPTKILIFPSFLKTLQPLDYISGLGEIYKFHILQNKIERFNPSSNILNMVYESLLFKASILRVDEFDTRERKFLNFGHTFGHALESVSNYMVPHGIAVVVGCIIALHISKQLNFRVPNYDIAISKGLELIKLSNVNFKQEWFDFELLIKATKSDKKSTGKLTMVLIDNIPTIIDVENLNIVETILSQTYESIRLRS